MNKICTNTNEKWRDVVGYEGLYQVSNTGKIRSHHKGKWKDIVDCATKYGYKVVLLYKNGVRKSARVHRLVAEAFIPNPNNYPYINHKDENPLNNCAENLEWCTPKYNSNYGTATKRRAEKFMTPILMFDIDGNILKTFNSIIDAERELKHNHECISRCCSGKILSYKNCIWLYKGQESLLQERIDKCKKSNNFHRIARCDMDGNVLQIYPNISIAARESVTSRTQIDRQLKKNIISKNSKWLWKLV